MDDLKDSDSMDAFRECVICPHACRVDRTSDQFGICKAGDSMRVSRASLHFWEEPPISGSHGSGTIFFSNCNLGCSYCQNYAISTGGAGKVASVDDVVSMCLDLECQGAMNINFVTPTHFAPLVRRSIEVALNMGLSVPIVWNTSGYESVATIKENGSLVDVYLSDFKYFDEALSKRLSGVADYRERSLDALDAMLEVAGRPKFDEFHGEERLIGGVVVRHMLIPGHLDDSKKVISMLEERYGDDVLLSIMNQYTPVLATMADKGNVEAKRALELNPELGRVVSDEEYEALLDYADSIGVRDYYWQDGQTCKESFIPDFE